MKEAVESADTEVHRSRRHRENDRAHTFDQGEDPDTRGAERQAKNPAAEGGVGQRSNQEQNNAERNEAAADQDDDIEQEDATEEGNIKQALKNPIEPEQLFNWSAEAEDEVVGDF